MSPVHPPETLRRSIPKGGALALLIASVLAPVPLVGQDPPIPTGWEFTGVPALNYDSDEGFGFGAVLAFYDYGDPGILPYRITLQPTLFFTTKGRRDLTLFLDAPTLPGGWRLSAFLGVEKQIATPYYGSGNDAPYDPALEEGENPYYYRFGRARNVIRANVQKSLGDLPLRVLIGGQIAHFRLDPTPRDEGSTLLQEDLGSDPVPGGYQNSIRGGLVWDTRDRESGPGRGVWSALLAEWVGGALGSEDSYVRWTLTDRRYFSLSERLVLANRFTLQHLAGHPPFFVLTYIQSSFGEGEGLGGAGSVRGVLRNRFFGEGLFLWNLELRWRALGFRFLGKNAHLAVIAFLDSGRVWEKGVAFSSLFADLHHGGGTGLRLGLGPNFVIATDFATSGETGLRAYIGLGYLF